MKLRDKTIILTMMRSTRFSVIHVEHLDTSHRNVQRRLKNLVQVVQAANPNLEDVAVVEEEDHTITDGAIFARQALTLQINATIEITMVDVVHNPPKVIKTTK